MESLDELIEKNLQKAYLLYSSNQGLAYQNSNSLQDELRAFKGQKMFGFLDPDLSETRKKAKTESNPQKDLKSHTPSADHLNQLLTKSSEASALELFQNKYLSLQLKTIEPQWHAPWKLMRVISGHQGWVRCLSVDPTNNWFASGSNDRMIKIWDMASGQLRLSLVGHINAVRSVIVSDRHPYLFSCGEDKRIHCWDLEHNKIVRHYNGHLSGIFCLALHPTLDVLISGSRDTVCRVWDIRMKTQVRVLEGHTGTVFSVAAQGNEPQIISGASDCTVKLWDIVSGKPMKTLTKHKKSIRSVKFHSEEYTFLSAAADNLKLWRCPDGEFLRHFEGHEAIINDFAINQDNVMVTGADNGSLGFWDYTSGFKYQEIMSKEQPGSLSSEAGIFATCFDKSGIRLLTGECDKTIKIWKEDEEATPETHPLPKEARVFRRTRY